MSEKTEKKKDGENQSHKHARTNHQHPDKVEDQGGNKTEATKKVDAGKAKNPMGEKAKAHGHEEHEGEKDKNDAGQA